MLSCGRATGALFTTSYGDCRRGPTVRDEKRARICSVRDSGRLQCAPARIRGSHRLSPTAPWGRTRRHPPPEQASGDLDRCRQDDIVRKGHGQRTPALTSVVAHVVVRPVQLARIVPQPGLPERAPGDARVGQKQARARGRRPVRRGGQPAEAARLHRLTGSSGRPLCQAETRDGPGARSDQRLRVAALPGTAPSAALLAGRCVDGRRRGAPPPSA